VLYLLYNKEQTLRMQMMNAQQRMDRILTTSKIIYLEDMTIHEVAKAEIIGDIIFVDTGTGLLFQDLDVLTLDEACDAERFINKIKESLYNI